MFISISSIFLWIVGEDYTVLELLSDFGKLNNLVGLNEYWFNVVNILITH